jgi:hypothetical protein
MGRAVNGTAFFLISKMLFFCPQGVPGPREIGGGSLPQAPVPRQVYEREDESAGKGSEGGEGTCSRHRLSLFPDYHQRKEKRRVAIELYQSETLNSLSSLA